MTRRLGALLLVLSALAAGLAGGASAGAADRTGDRPAQRRVIVISVPGLRWIDVDADATPHLRALLDESAIANLSTRVTGRSTRPGDGYLTISAGTRAVASSTIAGLAYDGTEPFGAGTAADEYARQQGQPLAGDIASLSWVLLAAQNADTEFRADIGALGDALEAADVARGVVAQADGVDPLSAGGPAQRDAALALADHTGVVACGSVAPQLLATDSAAPYGVRLDERAVLQQVERCSTADSVVLVEASDLRRAAAFANVATPERAQEEWGQALAATDHLVAALLTGLDPDRDAVVVVAPTTARHGLGVVGIRAPEVAPGLLTSGNTRRPGYVLLADLAPSIAELAGTQLDDGAIEGRPVESRAGHGSASDRLEELISGESAALFRDRMVNPAVLLLVIAVGILALAAAAVFAFRWDRFVRWLEPPALVLLSFPVVTYLAGLLPFHDWGGAAYWLFLAVGSVLLAGVALVLRGALLGPLIVAHGLLVAVVSASVVVLGSRLQQSTVFGDSPIIAGRFTGINNVTFAFFILSAIVLACAVMQLAPPRWNRWWMVGLLTAVLVIDVAPMWGADVGGALAGLPALALLALLLGRWKVRWRTVALLALASVALVVVLGLLDLTRDSADRSHLGRLFERIGSEGAGGITTVVERKLGANLRSLSQSPWRYVFPPVVMAVGLVLWRARDRTAAVAAAFPALVPALPGLGLAALLGYGLNDSGIAVPAAMVSALVPGLVYLACRVSPDGHPVEDPP